jgi:hypothetical protein
VGDTNFAGVGKLCLKGEIKVDLLKDWLIGV